MAKEKALTPAQQKEMKEKLNKFAATIAKAKKSADDFKKEAAELTKALAAEKDE